MGKPQEKTLKDLRDWLMTHEYFKQCPEDPVDVMRRIKAWTIKPAPFQVSHAEMQKCIEIIMGAQYQYANPMDILGNPKTFDTGVCMLPNIGFVPQRKSSPEAIRLQKSIEYWGKKYQADSVYREYCNMYAHQFDLAAQRQRERLGLEIIKGRVAKRRMNK